MFAREMVNKMSHNCPNCGAPIHDVQCPYCGTIYYDFAILDADRPIFMRANIHGKTLTFKAILREVSVDMMNRDVLPDVTIGLTAVPYGDGGYYFVESKRK